MTLASTMHTLTLGEGFILVSFWKPLFFVATLAAWAWIVSTVYDKHAARFFLPRQQWNLFHIGMGLLATLVAFFFPLGGIAGFLLAWVSMVVLLIASLVAYAISANKDDRVPAAYHIKLDILTKMKAAKAAKEGNKNQAQVKLAIRGADKALVPAPMAETPEYEVRTAAENIFIKALDSRASQVDVAPVKDGAYSASMLVDGVRVPGDTMPAPAAIKVIDFWKSAAKLDVADRRKRLVGDINVSKDTTSKKVRLTSIGVQGGMRLTMLFNPEEAVKRKPDELGLLDVQMNAAKELTSSTKGIVLLAGMPDGGRTTTLYSVLQLHDAYTQTVQTLELEPQLAIEGVRHQAFDANVDGAEFATTMRSLLRRDPDVLGVSDIPDQNTAKQMCQADLERTRVYACVRADSALAAIDQWVKLVGDAPLAAKGLRGVIAGRLMRKLCVNCRAEYPASPEMLKKLGVPDGKQVKLFKKGGQVLIKNKPETCPVCQGVGYVGQEGIFEVYPLDDEDRSLIASGNLAAVKANLRKKPLPTIQQSAIRKALSGITSVEEVMRVTAPAAVPAPASTPAPASNA
jgi:type II secretory ATPase GspE/PulE/Tfp pilus assembly ATPase PilB-like protein